MISIVLFFQDSTGRYICIIMCGLVTVFYGPLPYCLAMKREHGLQCVLAGYARVLVTSSVESQQGSPGYMPYNAAKWSLMAFQEEWVNTHTVNAQTNVEIVTLLPGTVNTSLGYTGIFGGSHGLVSSCIEVLLTTLWKLFSFWQPSYHANPSCGCIQAVWTCASSVEA